MPIRLIVTAGPHVGKEFAFDRHDTFLVGRSSDAHLRFSYDDPYFSRRHFLVEANPPRCRVLDLNSRNGIFVNGNRLDGAELAHGDEVRAGTTSFRFEVPSADQQVTLDHPQGGSAVSDLTRSFRSDEVEGIRGYRVGDELGRGGMGVVYRAVREADGVPVALKVITPSTGAGHRDIERFIREARILSGLNHPNVVGHFESGSDGPRIFLVMELVEGSDASRMRKARELPVPVCVRIVVQALRGLEHAHQRGFVHRDVKPSNILIGGAKGRRTAKLADFGLARAYDDCGLSGLTMQGDVGGTPAFMAPEQVTHFRDVRPAADQYSAAATLYYLLTGSYPHDLPKDIGRQLACIISRPPVPVASRCKGLPPGLAAVVDRALSREPDQRFPAVRDFRIALMPFVADTAG